MLLENSIALLVSRTEKQIYIYIYIYKKLEFF